MHCRKECPKGGHYLTIILPTTFLKHIEKPQQTWSGFSPTKIPDNNRQSGLLPTTVPEMSTGNDMHSADWFVWGVTISKLIYTGRAVQCSNIRILETNPLKILLQDLTEIWKCITLLEVIWTLCWGSQQKAHALCLSRSWYSHQLKEESSQRINTGLEAPANFSATNRLDTRNTFNYPARVETWNQST